MDFKNKVVIITGASSGIGAAAAKMFSDAGARTVMVGRNKSKLSSSAALCSSPFVIVADITNDDDAKRVIDETIKKFGQIDVLVNNAGMTTWNDGLLEGNMMKAYDAILNVNLRAVVHLTTLAAPHLIKVKGNIVNVSSVAGMKPPYFPGVTNYYVAKAAVIHFTTCSAVELGPHGVRVNVVSPGPVKTDFFENAKATKTPDDFCDKTILNRVSEPEEIAETIFYLASDKARGITGVNWWNDNGMLIKRN